MEVSIRVKSMDRRTIGTKNPGRYGVVVAIERWPLVEVTRIFPSRKHVCLFDALFSSMSFPFSY